MPNLLRVSVDNPDELLNAGAYGAGALVHRQWSATSTGAYADLSGTGSTPTIPIVTLTNGYLGFDPNGTASTWYQTRYENAGATRLSDWTPPFQVGTQNLVGLDECKARITGLDSSEDNNILSYIQQATADIMGYTGRQFLPNPASGDSIFTFDVFSPIWPYSGSSGSTWASADYRVLNVPRGINHITTLELTGVTGGTYATADPSIYFLRPNVQDREYGWPATSIGLSDVAASRFFPGYGTVRLTGGLGWATVPADIQNVAYMIVGQIFNSRADPGGGEAFTLNLDGSRSYSWNRAIFGILNRYKQAMVG
jgi:hypothetical protein